MTEEQKAIKKAAREFAEKEFAKDLLLKCEEEDGADILQNLIRKASQLGFSNIEFPVEYGGQGYTFFEKVLVTEEFCRVGSGVGVAVAEGCGVAATLVNAIGTDEQKRKYLPPALRGDGGIAGAFTEPAHGTDITFLETSAKKERDGWVINGTKTFISGAFEASSIAVLCQTNPDAKPSYRGQTLFLVDRNADGVEITKLKPKLGLHAWSTCEVKFDNVYVDNSSILGELNKGFYHTLLLFNQLRILGGVRSLGMAEGAFEAALKHAKERIILGKSLANFQGIRWMLAKMFTKIELAKLLVYKAAHLESRGVADPVLPCMVKAWVVEEMLNVIDEAIQIFGGLGYMTETDVERRWRDARAFKIAGGTREMALNTIADFIIEKNYPIVDF
ncbi:MAG: acyl-CoA dehydrogenase family protein [Candidatus Bathyarchaeota archaeon]